MKQTRREFVHTLFVATQAAMLGILIPTSWQKAFATEKSRTDGVRFLVFGDWGRQGQSDQVAVAVQMAKATQEINAQFIISTGDNFYDYGVASVEDPLWKKSFEEVYHESTLQIPWHAVLGNHDYRGNCDAQIAYHETHARWNMPSRYYTVTQHIDEKTDVDFFFIDTTPMIKEYYNEMRTREQVISQDAPKQITWLKNALTSSKAAWKIVVGHHPVYSGGEHGGTPELIETLLAILQEHKVQAYFNGHDHDLQHIEAGGINFFDSGAGSLVREPKQTEHTKFAKGCPGFTTAAVYNDKMQIHMIDSKGTLLYATSIPRGI